MVRKSLVSLVAVSFLFCVACGEEEEAGSVRISPPPAPTAQVAAAEPECPEVEPEIVEIEICSCPEEEEPEVLERELLDEPARDEEATRYTVQEGDSLWEIAVQTMGDGTRWEELYEINRSAIGSDPLRLRLGTVLSIPPPEPAAVAAQHDR